MAEKKKKETEKSDKTVKTWSTNKILEVVGYFAMMCIAVALIFRLGFKEFSPTVAKSFQSIGECLAYVVCMWLGFYWTRRKKNVWWLVCWIVAAVVITVVYIFAMI
jgi:hypothetical protein